MTWVFPSMGTFWKPAGGWSAAATDTTRAGSRLLAGMGGGRLLGVPTDRFDLGDGHVVVVLAVERPQALHHEDLDQRRVEHDAAVLAQQPLALFEREGLLVRAIGGHRVVGVGDGDDARRERD